jgi:adenylate cyclase
MKSFMVAAGLDPSDSPHPSAADRLDSWKEIAAHLGRTVRTVQRWERTCELPVHRHLHSESSSVYAFRSELDAWWFARSGQRTHDHPAEGQVNLQVPGSARRHDHPTVGRADERRELMRAFERTASGRGILVAVSGEPGIGKTTLVEDFLTELGPIPTSCYTGRGRSSESLAGGEAYLPLLDALEDLLRRDTTQTLAPALKLIAPLWFGQLGVRTTGSALSNEGVQTGTGTQQRLKRELLAFLQDASRNRPVVLFLDDLQWLDPSSLDVLGYLTRHFDSLAVMIVVTYRPEELLVQKHPFLPIKHDLQARGLCRDLALAMLTREDLAHYVDLEFPGLPPAFVDVVFAKTEGNPLFMVGVLDYLRERHVLKLEGDNWTLTRSAPDLARDLPESVRGMIQRKIDLLPEAKRRLLVTASAQGLEFQAAIIARVLSLDPVDVEEQLDSLEHAYGFVRKTAEQELPDGSLTLRYQFVHVLYQDRLRASLTPSRLMSLSRAVAGALEAAYGDHTAEIASRLATLYETAREFRRAADYFLEAARRAAKVFAYDDAIELGYRGLDAAAHLPVDDRRSRELTILLTIGFPIRAVRGFASEQLHQLYERARILCTALNRTHELRDVLWGLWASQLVRLEIEGAHETVDRLDQLAVQDGHPVVSIQADIARGLVAHYSGDFAAAHESCTRALTKYDPRRHGPLPVTAGWDPAMSVRGHMAWTSLALGYPDRAVSEVEAGVQSARDVAHVPTLVYALFFAIFIHQWRGDQDRFQRYLDEMHRLALDYQLVHFVTIAAFLQGQTLAQEGRLAEGLEQMREGLARYGALRARTCRSRFVSAYGGALGLAGRPDEGLELLDEEIASIGRARFYEAELLRTRGELLHMRKAASADGEAERSLMRALDVARVQHARSFELRVLLSLHRLRSRPGDDSRIAELQAALSGPGAGSRHIDASPAAPPPRT